MSPMKLVFRSDEPEYPFDREVVELDKGDHETILRLFSSILDLHKDLGKPLPPLRAVELFQESNRITWLVDDVGYIYAVFDTDHSASVHITFFDRRLRGREPVCRGLADWVLANYGLSYLHTTIPESSRATLAFAKRIGFERVWRDPDGKVYLVYSTKALHRVKPEEAQWASTH